MFNPNFKLDTNLFQIINECERFYGQLESLKIPRKIELNLERDTKIKSSYISNSMEGNPLSLPEVTNLLLDDRVPTNRDEKEIVNYFNILKTLDEYNDGQLNLQKVLQIHKDLMSGVSDKIAGKVRNKPIIVGKYKEEEGKVKLDIKHNPPSHKKEELEKLLKELIKWANDSDLPAILKTGIFHHEFVYIHPFEDGNGRTCRLLTALLLIKEEYQINKYFVLDDYYDVDRKAYSDALHTADKGDKSKWLEYFSQGCKYSLQTALSRVKNSINTLKVSERPTKREKEVFELIQERKEITAAEVAKILDISRQQAHNLLKGLVEKGLVAKEGSTKASYYKLKKV
ncbi:Fic family protein [Patescibacteria group bacterium]